MNKRRFLIMKTPMTAKEADKRNQEILEGWNTKRPWPRSAKVTVWVLGILLTAIFLLFLYILILSAPPTADIVY
ncbi:hypothetical protein CXU17_04585 [Akkermansia muciniphila]|nr:hypothetical protein CXU17_04585 [Akkermansia muciniphila]